MKFLILATLLASAAIFPIVHAANASAAVAQRPDPAAAANAVLDELDAGRFDAVTARFNPTMAQAVGADKLKAVWQSLPRQFGKLQHRGDAVVLTQDGMTVVKIPLVHERGTLEAIIATDADGKIAGFFVRPAPPPPAAARGDLPSREVKFAPAQRGELPGTLLLPKGEGPFPAVVFVHGSGPNDRDETVGGTRVFRDLADGLADRGIASLRYEKRTKARPLDFGGAYTIDDETTDDAVAAVAFLRAQHEVDPKRIFVVGHSQGAMMAPRIAQRSPQLAGIVLMAAPARPLEDILLDQNIYLATTNGKLDDASRAQLEELKRDIATVKKIDMKTPATQKFLLDLPASYWRSLQGYDAVAVAKTIPQSMLILQGDRDFQVTAPDWRRWHGAFGADRRATIKHYPALNHLFVAGSGHGDIAEYNRPAHVDAHVVDDIADWVKMH
jgi:dienelactone hydrolase